jgi:hypothetical protein
MISFSIALYPAIVLGVLLLKPDKMTISMQSLFYSYIRSIIYIDCFLLLAFPLIYPDYIVFLASSSPHPRSFFIQASMHWRLFYTFAGTVYFSKPAIVTSDIYGLLGSSSNIFKRASKPCNFSLFAFDFSIWPIE